MWGTTLGARNTRQQNTHGSCSHGACRIAVVVAELLNHVQLFASPKAVACQAPLSMRFSREELPRVFLT